MPIGDWRQAASRWTAGRHVLIWLALALVPAFSVTAFVASAHRGHQQELAVEWDARGQAALTSGQPSDAVAAFRNALRFSPGDRDLRLRLAESLAAAERVTEARSYLLGLWQDQPGSGRVNLQLGRLAARQGDVTEVVRYFHNAIEGAWSSQAENRRRETRLELAEYLVSQGSTDLAEVELLALAADLPPDIPTRLHVADLLTRARAERRALTIFDAVLAEASAEPAALTGAARASLALGKHAAVVRYLRRIPAGELEPGTATMLEVSSLVLALDPYRRGLSSRNRASRVLRGLEAADARLTGCVAEAPALAALKAETAAALKAETRNALARNPDRMEELAGLTFRAEDTAEGRCGAAAPIDRALLLLGAQPAEGNP